MENKKSVPFKWRIIISVFSVALIPVLILAFFAYNIYITEVEEKTQANTLIMINQVENKVENMLESVRSYYAEMGIQESVEWLRDDSKNKGYRDYVNLIKASEYLRGPVYLQEYLDGYMFIDGKQDKVLTNKGIWDFASIDNWDEINSVLNKNSGSTIWWENRIDKNVSVVSSKKGDLVLNSYMLVMSFPALPSENSSYFIAKLNKQKLYELVVQDMPNVDIVLMDENKELVYSKNKEFGDYLQENAENIIREEGKYFDVTLESGKIRATAKHSRTSGMTYVIAYNHAEVNEGANRILAVAWILLLVLIIVMGLVILSSRIIYGPVHALRKKLGKQFDLDMQGDEIHYFEKSFAFLTNKSDTLAEKVHSQQKELKALFLQRLIRGEMRSESITLNLEEFGMTRKTAYQIMTLRCIHEEEEFRESTTLSDSFYITLIESIPESIREKVFLPPSNKGNAIVFLFGGDEDEINQNLLSVHSEMSEFMAVYASNCTAKTGISRKFHKLSYLRTALNESFEALKNNSSEDERETDSDTGIKQMQTWYYEDFIMEQDGVPKYDLLLEAEVREAIDRRETEVACQVMNQFVDKLIMEKLSLEDRNYYMTRFLIAMLKVATDAGIHIKQIFSNDHINIFTYLGEVYDDRKVRNFYADEVIVPLVDKLTEFRNTNANDIFQNVLKLVKESNADITLSECAEKLNYHPSYIWKVLKNEKNMTFTDFVAMEKLEIAKDMLKNTDLSIANIASELNYTNTQNFIRFFSKREGISPGKYRTKVNS